VSQIPSGGPSHPATPSAEANPATAPADGAAIREAAREGFLEERRSALIYAQLCHIETEPRLMRMFERLGAAAQEQATFWERRMRDAGAEVPSEVPIGLRATIVLWLARRSSVRAVRGLLSVLKVRGLVVYTTSPPTGHGPVTHSTQIGQRHKMGGGNLRAAVFGINDGLVSNASLIFGMAGAAVGSETLLLVGIAGLLAGAFSMAAGEYVSVRSQREVFEYQIGLERAELEEYPEAEAQELAIIYEAKGVPPADAKRLADTLIADPERALDTLAREELGLNPDELGSPWGAAISSFVAFAAGALIPLVPFLLVEGATAFRAAVISAAAALFAVGALLSLFTGRSALLSGARMLAIGAAAGIATYAIGSLLGAPALP